jgi:hypothetical protein
VGNKITIVSEQPLKQIWSYLSVFQSENVAEKYIRKKAVLEDYEVPENILREKAIGTSYCISNAKDFLIEIPEVLNKRILNTYYGFVYLLSSIMISDPSSDYNLDKLELVTKKGHGLGTVDSDADDFLETQNVYLKSDGFFCKYLKYTGHDTSNVAIYKQVNTTQDLEEYEIANIISLNGLLARIPELSDLYYELMDLPPLNVRLMKRFNHPEVYQGEDWANFVPVCHLDYDFVINSLEPPLFDIRCYSMVKERTYAWCGKFKVERGKNWLDIIGFYGSPICGYTWVKPVLGLTNDIYVIHFMILFTLSILVRYRPSLWREITNGRLDQFLPLITVFLDVFDRIIPQFVLQNLTLKWVRTALPGTLQAPFGS